MLTCNHSLRIDALNGKNKTQEWMQTLLPVALKSVFHQQIPTHRRAVWAAFRFLLLVFRLLHFSTPLNWHHRLLLRMAPIRGLWLLDSPRQTSEVYCLGATRLSTITGTVMATVTFYLISKSTAEMAVHLVCVGS